MAGLGAACLMQEQNLCSGTKVESREGRALYSLTFLHSTESWQAQGLEGDMHNLMPTEGLNRVKWHDLGLAELDGSACFLLPFSIYIYAN